MARKLVAIAGATTLVALASVNDAEAAALARPVLKHRFQISTYKVAWYEGKGAWTRRPRFHRCRDLKARKAEDRCYAHRQGYRFHLQRLHELRVRLWPRPRAAVPVAAHDWSGVAACESGGDWAANTGNGFTGGLQFTSSTWLSNGGGAYASSANLASASQQIAVAERVLVSQGIGAWPICGRYLR